MKNIQNPFGYNAFYANHADQSVENRYIDDMYFQYMDAHGGRDKNHNTDFIISFELRPLAKKLVAHFGGKYVSDWRMPDSLKPKWWPGYKAPELTGYKLILSNMVKEFEKTKGRKPTDKEYWSMEDKAIIQDEKNRGVYVEPNKTPTVVDLVQTTEYKGTDDKMHTMRGTVSVKEMTAIGEYLKEMVDQKRSNFKNYHKQKNAMFAVMDKWYGGPGKGEEVFRTHPAYAPFHEVLKQWYEKGVNNDFTAFRKTVQQIAFKIPIVAQFAAVIKPVLGAIGIDPEGPGLLGDKAVAGAGAAINTAIESGALKGDGSGDGFQFSDIGDALKNIDVKDALKNINIKDALKNINLKDLFKNIDVGDIDLKGLFKGVDLKDVDVSKLLEKLKGKISEADLKGILAGLMSSNSSEQQSAAEKLIEEAAKNDVKPDSKKPVLTAMLGGSWTGMLIMAVLSIVGLILIFKFAKPE